MLSNIVNVILPMNDALLTTSAPYLPPQTTGGQFQEVKELHVIES